MAESNLYQRACIVLPTYNEAENIPVIVPAIFQQSEKVDSHEIFVLVVDDNSPDGTQEQVKRLMKQFPNLFLITGEKKGLGEAYKKGMAHAMETLEADLIFEMDADLQHDPALIPLFVYLTRFDFNLVIGSRFAPGGSTPNFSLKRRLISLFGNWLIRFLGGLPRIRDCTSGFRCIKREVLEKSDLSFLSTRGYSFQSSLLCELIRNGARVIEVPIIFPDRQRGESKLSLRDQMEFIVNIPKIRYRNSGPFIRFCIAGITGMVVNAGGYLFLTRTAGLSFPIAALIAIELSILWNYLVKYFPFRHLGREEILARLVQFHLISGAGAFVNYLVFLLLVRGFDLFDMIAYLIGIAAGVLVNYSAHSFWVWKELREKEGVPDRDKL